MTSATPPPRSDRADAIPCEKCGGQMLRDRIRRFSSGLVVIGYTLWIPALLILLGASACGALVVGGSATATTEMMTQAEQDAVDRLREIENLPVSVVTEFQDRHSVSDASLASLSDVQRQQVELAVSFYDSSLIGSGIGSGVAMGGGMLFVLAAYVTGIPFFIAGLILTLRKNVWRCGRCSYVFDRA